MTDYIYRYSRAQAIEDGVLVDVSETAREAGITFPVALTAAVYQLFVVVPEGVEAQDEAGRLWDVIWMLRHAILNSDEGASRIDLHLHVRNDNSSGEPPLVHLVAVCGPGDDAEPVITVMLPDEED